MKQVIVAIIASLPIGLLVFWALDRAPPWEFTDVEISPTSVMQCGEMDITFTARRLRASCGAGVVYRQYKDSSGRSIVYDPVARADAPELDSQNKFTRSAKISCSMDPGPATYRGQACYTCNPLQSWLRWPVCAPTPEVPFYVLKKP